MASHYRPADPEGQVDAIIASIPRDFVVGLDGLSHRGRGRYHGRQFPAPTVAGRKGRSQVTL
jgi:hypothetical protein